MKRILFFLILTVFCFFTAQSQIPIRLAGDYDLKQIEKHLDKVNLKHLDTTFIYSATPEKSIFVETKSNSDLHFPYPVIFIHGLVGSADTWLDFYNYAIAQNWSYGGHIKFNLNSDDDLSYSNIYSNHPDATDFNGNLNAADFYLMNFNCNLNGVSFGSNHNTLTQSNQAAIIKQGLAVRNAISHVLEATGRNKVVLFGHSMGGLAARQYMQNPDFWQSDGEHHIAKIVTSGTPHGGSNASLSFLIDIFTDTDERSDAVRDLRRSYFYSGQSGVFLYGGIELGEVMDDHLFGSFHNSDVNCNGATGNQITGLNLKDIYIDLDYACIIGDWIADGLIGEGDGIVEVEDAQLKNFYNITSETFTILSPHTSILHTDLTDYTKENFYALDEPDYYDLSYEIEVNEGYNGFITKQANDAEYQTVDYDDFVFSTNELGFVSISLLNTSSSILGVSIIDKETFDIVYNDFFQSGQHETEPITLPQGEYYLELYANTSDTSWKSPYFFRLNWTLNNPTSIEEELSRKIQITANPNPVNSNLSLKIEGLADFDSELKILNQTGQTVHFDSFTVGSIETKIDFSSFPSGIYLLTLNTKEGIFTKKIIKE